MAHDINAVIGLRFALAQFEETFGPPAATALPYDMAIVPLGHDRLDCLSGERKSPSFDGFVYLNPELERGIGSALKSGRLLYVETHYFGGIGSQAAALFEDGVLTWRASSSTEPELAGPKARIRSLFSGRKADQKTPISRGLASLGVPTVADGDEFDALGLGIFRSLEDLGLDEWPDNA